MVEDVTAGWAMEADEGHVSASTSFARVHLIKSVRPVLAHHMTKGKELLSANAGKVGGGLKEQCFQHHPGLCRTVDAGIMHTNIPW